MKFILETLVQSVTSYAGVSGKRYIIYKGTPFEVKDKTDIEFFKSKKQFKQVGILKGNKSEPQKDIDEKLYDELEKIRGISPKVAKKVVDIYVSKKLLMDALEGGGNLGTEFTKRQQNYIRNHFIKK